jgi:DNA primase
MDVIALHAAGFENAVATLGTAITPEQARLISKYTKNVVISYDMDNAGRAAADKAMRLLSDVGVDVKVLNMTGAKDPDEYIKKFGPDKFSQLINKSQTGFDYKLNKTLEKYDLSIGEDKIKASSEICEIISKVPSSVERAVYISAASERLKLSVDVLTNDVERKRRAYVKEFRAKEGQDAQMLAKNIGDRINPDSAKNIQAAAAEEAILGLMLLFDEHRSAVASGKVKLSREDFFTELGAKAFEKILELQNSDGGYMKSMLGEHFSVDEMGRLQRMEHKRLELVSNGADVFEASVNALKSSVKKETAKDDWMAEIARRQRELKAKKDNK